MKEVVHSCDRCNCTEINTTKATHLGVNIGIGFKYNKKEKKFEYKNITKDLCSKCLKKLHTVEPRK